MSVVRGVCSSHMSWKQGWGPGAARLEEAGDVSIGQTRAPSWGAKGASLRG